MQIQQILLVLFVAGAVGAMGHFVAGLFFGRSKNRLSERLRNERVADFVDAAPKDTSAAHIRSLVARLGQAAASPFMPKGRDKMTGMRKQLAMAGIYAPPAIKAVQGFKFILLLGGLGVGVLLGTLTGYLLLGFAVGGLIGYLMPTMWLKGKITENQKLLQLGLPDALDLLVVCVEAGLTVDASMQRVGEELAVAHPAVGREFGIAHMETRIGIPRSEALRNMGLRTGNPAVQQFVAMLVQAERFGTSIGDALRIQSETLRIKRQHIAEEMAAKASVKMSFPLVLFIFPATFIVLAGPTVLGLFKSELFK
jgi:tight adherence protein C